MSEIIRLFETVCAENGERCAMIYRRGRNVCRKSFAELHDDVQKMRTYYAVCGVRQGDRLLALAPSSYGLCVAMLAALETGASIMYVDILARQESLRRVFADYRPQWVLVSDQTKYLRMFFGEIGKIRSSINIDRFARYSVGDVQASEIPEETTALLTMTTGSTDAPKIAVRSHRDLMQQLALINRNMCAAEHETVLTTSYIYIFANLLNGFTTVMPLLNLGRYSSRKVNRILSLFQNEPITIIITSPDFCLKAENRFSVLKTIYFGGAILNLHEAELIYSKFGCCDCRVIYGSTECNLIAMVTLDEFIRVLKTEHRSILGRPVNGVRVRCSDEGEILVASEAMLRHYLISAPSTKETDVDGTLWHHTNDMAEAEGGLLYYLGKSRRYILVGEQRIYSNCIEQEIIARFPHIPKCAVLQHKDTLFVILQKAKKSVDTEAVKVYLSLLGIERPVLQIIGKIPCDVKHHTKINYDKLKERL